MQDLSSKLDSVISMLSTDFNAIEASDNLLLTVFSGDEISAGSSETSDTRKTLAGTFHIDLTGTVRIRARLQFTSAHGSGCAALYRGDTEIKKSTWVNSKTASNYTIVSFDANVNAGNDYSIYVLGHGSAEYSGRCYMNLAEVRGTYKRDSIDYIYKV